MRRIERNPGNELVLLGGLTAIGLGWYYSVYHKWPWAGAVGSNSGTGGTGTGGTGGGGTGGSGGITDQQAANWIWGCKPLLSYVYAVQKGMWPDCGETTNDADNPRSAAQKLAIVRDWIANVDPQFKGQTLQQVADYFGYTANPNYQTKNWDWLFSYLYNHRPDIQANFSANGYFAYKMSENAAPCQWTPVEAMRVWWAFDCPANSFGNQQEDRYNCFADAMLPQLQAQVQGVWQG